MSQHMPMDDWEQAWDARKRFLEAHLGPAQDKVGHASVPFEMGPEAGGAADVLYFRQGVPGVLSVTSALLSEPAQVANTLGHYELAIAHRDDEPWGPNIISRLAHYTLECALNPGETMSIGSAVPRGSSIQAFLFEALCQGEFDGSPAGVLLCIGITADELQACQSGRLDEVRQALKDAGVFPHTDLARPSVL